MKIKKTLAESIESGDPIKGPSMGCAIDLTPCPICGVAGEHNHSGVLHHYDPNDYSHIQFIAASFVVAPTCDQCLQPMEYLKTGTDWACRDELCTAFNVSVSTSVGGLIG